MSQTYASGGTNDTTGREPFGDSTGTGHHGHHHGTSGLGSTTTSGNTGYGSSTGVGGPIDHLKDNTRGDIKAGTSADPAVGRGRETGEDLLYQGSYGKQTGDEFGGVQTGSTSTGTGHNLPVEGAEKRGLTDKIKDAVGMGHKSGDNTSSTSHHTGTGSGYEHEMGTGAGLAGGAGATGTGVGTHHHSSETGLTGNTNVGSGLTSGTGSGLTSGTGIGSGAHTGEHHQHHHHGHQGTHTDVTGTLGSGLSTGTTSTVTGTREFEELPVDHTTGQVHHFTTTTTGGSGIGSGLTSSSHTGTGLGSGTHHHHEGHHHGEGTQYGSNTAARDYDTNTSGLTGTGTGLTGSHSGTGLTGSHSGTGLTGSHTGTGLTGSHGTSGLTSGNDSSAGYDRSSGVGNTGVGGLEGREGSGPLSSGAAGTDRFDVDRSSSGALSGNDYGHNVGDKHSNDHKVSGLTRHGDDFTGGDTADSAYKNYGRTGLTGREGTTTGVHDQNLESTAPQGEGLMSKIKNVFGGHTNTSHADDATASTTRNS